MTFLVLDGVDGCGKSTQAAHLAKRLEVGGRAVRHLREPGSTPVGEILRTLLLDTDVEIGPQVEVLLFAAARRQLIETVIAPAEAAGEVVVCERSDASTFAYQAVAGELDEEDVLDLLAKWATPIAPDLVIILDVDPDVARTRRGADRDRIEAKGQEHQRAVAEGYRRYAGRFDNAILVDASGEPDAVFDRVWNEVQRVL